MTKSEFLDKLRTALGNDLTGPIIQENINYYDQYISDEVARGRSEEEVTAELGDPWVLAQTIIDVASENGGQGSKVYASEQENYGKSSARTNQNRYTYGVSWWKILLVILGIIGILAVVISVIGGVVSFLAPVLVPLLIVAIIVRAFSGKR